MNAAWRVALVAVVMVGGLCGCSGGVGAPGTSPTSPSEDAGPGGDGSDAASDTAPAGDAGTDAVSDADGGDPRQTLRNESIFQNLDFEQVDPSGGALHWQCQCPSSHGIQTCQTTTAHPEHGARSLVLPSGCYAVQTTTAFDPTKGVRFDGFSRGGIVMPADFYVMGQAAGGSFENLYTDGLPAAPPDWSTVASRGAMPAAGQRELMLVIVNSNGMSDYPTAGDGPTIYVDDVIAVQDVASPPPKVGALMRAIHYDTLGYQPSSPGGTLYLSLPIDWASQTPLYFELTVTPPNVVDHITYATEAENNWGATLTFSSTVAASMVVVRWDTVVLTRSVPDVELPAVFAALSPPAQWLAPSACIESSDANIDATATGLVAASATPLERMLGVIGWTSRNVTYGFAGTGLDALTAYDTRQSTCTGYANLGAAMGRALGVPARHLTNILSGMSQQMHSIDELYLGPSLGWRRVEPQGVAPRVPDDYSVAMRLVLPADEAGDPNELLGVPMHEFTAYLSGANDFGNPAQALNLFNDCNVCMNRADPQANLRDATPDAMKTLFAQARGHWQTTLGEFASGGVPSSEMATRRQAMHAKSLADVQALVSALH